MARITAELGPDSAKEGQIVAVRGDLVEGTAQVLGALAPKLGVRCSFDLAGVRSINSCGIAEWIEALETLAAGRLVTLRACSPAVVNALSLVPGFRGEHPVLSVLVPYACDLCRREFLRETPTPSSQAALATLGEAPCPDCARPAAAVVAPEDYLAFLAPP